MMAKSLIFGGALFGMALSPTAVAIAMLYAAIVDWSFVVVLL